MTNGGKGIPVSRCKSCGKCYVMPTYLCTSCYSTELEEATLNGKGKLATYTIIRTPPAGNEEQAPYTVAIIELDDGLRMTARVANDPVSNDIELFTPCEFVEHKGSVYWFRLASKK